MFYVWWFFMDALAQYIEVRYNQIAKKSIMTPDEVRREMGFI